MSMHTTALVARPNRPSRPTRRRFTADEVLAMEEAGILHPEEKVELIDGEIVTMAAKTPLHEDVRCGLADRWLRGLLGDVRVSQLVPLRLSEYFEPEPDFKFYSRDFRSSEVRGTTALLIVEVADMCLAHDLKVKAPIYAAHGVREYWVVDARRFVTYVHREPGPRVMPPSARCRPMSGSSRCWCHRSGWRSPISGSSRRSTAMSPRPRADRAGLMGWSIPE